MKPKTKRPDHCSDCTAYHFGSERWCCFYGQKIETALSQCKTQNGKQRKLDLRERLGLNEMERKLQEAKQRWRDMQ